MNGALGLRRIQFQRPQVVLLVLCLFFILVDALVMANLVAAGRQRDGLARQAVTLERALTRLQDRGAALGAAAAQLKPGENPFPAEPPTADLANLVVQSAQGAGMQITSLTPQLGGPEKLAQGTYRTYRLAVRATGTGAQTTDFLGRIQRGNVRTWVIDNTQARSIGRGLWEIAFDLTTYAQLPPG